MEGISLERTDVNLPTDDPDTWSSALQKDGFGTPGLANGNTSRDFGENNLVLNNKIFSPNNDGTEDQVEIVFQLNRNDYVANLRVYNDRGSEVAFPIQNEIIGAQGKLIWDGRTYDGNVAPIGLYILHLQLFALDGTTIEKNIAAGLVIF